MVPRQTNYFVFSRKLQLTRLYAAQGAFDNESNKKCTMINAIEYIDKNNVCDYGKKNAATKQSGLSKHDAYRVTLSR
jgi:hypothetical protein